MSPKRPGPGPEELRAVTVALDAPGPDPLSLAGAVGTLFAGPDLSLAGRGEAAVLDLPRGLDDAGALDRLVGWLSAVAHRDEVGRPGTRVAAHGALPFDRARPGRLVVPELTLGSDAQGRWVTWIGPSGRAAPGRRELATRLRALAGDPHDARPGPRTRTGPAPELRAVPSPDDYAASVAAAVAAMAVGPLTKVVLARCLDARFAQVLDPGEVLRRLARHEPACTAFAHDVDGGRFLGVTPELLVARSGSVVTCHPLAGTVALGGPDDDSAVARLLGSAKDHAEHRLVVEDIAALLRPRCSSLDVPRSPTLVRLHSVAHLGTLIEGKLDGDDRPVEHALGLLAALHPTPAVGGVPRTEALAYIRRSEAVDRDHWAGPVGWVDAAGDGEWMIGIRSATVSGDRTSARLCAGAGIVEDSDPADELAETTVKLAPVLEALAPGTSALLTA
ncbi:MAG: isochorismate synthase MenF [Acidimicrobiales bacterium]